MILLKTFKNQLGQTIGFAIENFDEKGKEIKKLSEFTFKIAHTP